MMELGITTFAETYPDPKTGEKIGHGERLRHVLEEIVLAEQVGLEVYGVGEHHRPDFASLLACGGARRGRRDDQQIRLTPAVVILSSDDPVRVFQDYATLDLVSNGRAELLVGRGSFIESFPSSATHSPITTSCSPRSSTSCWRSAIRSGSPGLAGSARHCRTRRSIPGPNRTLFPSGSGVGGSPESIVSAATRGTAGRPRHHRWQPGPIRLLRRPPSQDPGRIGARSRPRPRWPSMPTAMSPTATNRRPMSTTTPMRSR